MADNRKYYYLKLKENYFDSDAILLLESMQDGILYSYLLLKLYLKSLKNGGKLQLDEHIPYNAQMIATITRQQIGTVERALQIYTQLGLVEQLENEVYYMTNLELLIGQSSTEGERKRQARSKNSKGTTDGGQMSAICPPEIERELEIEKEIEIKKERELEETTHAPFLGQYNNVSLTTEEVATLEAELLQDYPTYLERLSEYMASTGKAYNSHFATIRKWYREDKAKNQGQQPRNYDCKEGESL